jgi:hypothetical protein
VIGGSRAMTAAVGGQREVPVPDPVAREYLLLALRLDQHIPGLVDGYFGPADLKAQVDIASIPPPARLRDDAAALRRRLDAHVAEPDRRAWLDAQLVALETQAAALAGEVLPYVEHLRRCFSVAPERRDDGLFDVAARELEALLPGDGDLADRLAAWDGRFTVPPERLPAIVDWLAAHFRERARELWGVPDGDDLRVSLVRDQPWTGYNWYDGGLRSRVDLNLDLPIRADALVSVVGHETYFGHHLEHAWREAEQVMRMGRMEASILLINTPECLISEGLADLGPTLALSGDDLRPLLSELHERAGLPASPDDIDRQVRMAAPRRRLNETRVNAALLRHADGRDHDEVLAYLREVGRFPPDAAAKRLEFIEHPLWRTYVFVYHEGEALLRRWVDGDAGASGSGEGSGAIERFGRLLREPLTPAAVAAEIGVDA